MGRQAFRSASTSSSILYSTRLISTGQSHASRTKFYDTAPRQQAASSVCATGWMAYLASRRGTIVQQDTLKHGGETGALLVLVAGFVVAGNGFTAM